MTAVNRFVEYLTRFYTGAATHQGVFDEYNLAERDRQYENVLHVHTAVESTILENFRSAKPTSVILTGNAGDGKTRICRAVVEELEGRTLDEWPANGECVIETPERPGFTLHVIKDLSDYDQEAARTILHRISESVESGSTTRFLIAANEGKLRHTTTGLVRLEQVVEEQLEHGISATGSALRVYNMNLEATSAYVAHLLKGMTRAELWAVCGDCPALHFCSIRANRDRLATERVQERMTFLYEVIEQTGVHLTIRDMLIHLTHTLVGSLTCKQVRTGLVHGAPESWKHAYFNNAFALSQEREYRQNLNVVRNLSRLEIGEVSSFEIDHFILQGNGSDEHAALFGSGVDMGGNYFKRLREQYLAGQGQGEAGGEQHQVLGLMPHARRKLIFEWSEEEKVGSLVALKTVRQYRRLLKLDARAATRQVAKELVLGLNRAFSGIYLTEDDPLYITAHLTGAAETQVPLIRAEVSRSDLSVEPFPDKGARVLHLRLRSRDEAPVLEIDQLLFEYLIRLAEGGTTEVLEAECSLRIRNYKDRLLSYFSSEEESELRFFVAQPNGYRKWEVTLSRSGRVALSEV